MKSFTVQPAPVFRYFLPLSLRYLFQYPILEHPQAMFSSQCVKVSHPYKTAVEVPVLHIWLFYHTVNLICLETAATGTP
jgi:hypothetical protein